VRGIILVRSADITKTKRARRLRVNATDAERKLWNRLRARSINNCKFVRQEPIGRYVVDFVCREQRLVIEVDGGQHASSPRDAKRERWLIDHHYRVMRFWNNDVLTNINGVLETIADALVQAPVSPSPLPACGERSASIARGEMRAG
jgi:very-short-patch-repair endonuclease